MEVIARRKEGFFWVHLITVAAGIIFFIIFLYLEYKTAFSPLGIAMIILSSLIAGSGAICLWEYHKISKEIIQYDGEKLIFPQGRYAPSEIINVTYRCARSRGFSHSWGKLTVTLSDKEIAYNYVADVEEVHNRLIQLKTEAQ